MVTLYEHEPNLFIEIWSPGQVGDGGVDPPS